MALKLNLEILSVDKMGRVITVKDATGDYHVDDNPGGYGAPNPTKGQIKGIAFSISSSCMKGEPTFLAERQPIEPPPPGCFVVMDIDEVLDGGDVYLNTIMFGMTTPEQGLANFRDGVIDVNYFVYLDKVTVVGEKGKNFITGESLPGIQTLDAVIINGEIYPIDHNKPVGDGTIMFLTKPLKANITSVYPAYQTNEKVYMDRYSKCVMSRMSGKLADALCNSCGDKDLLKRLLIIKHNRDASRLDFCEQDYKGADKKLRYAESLAKTLNCGCE